MILAVPLPKAMPDGSKGVFELNGNYNSHAESQQAKKRFSVLKPEQRRK